MKQPIRLLTATVFGAALAVAQAVEPNPVGTGLVGAFFNGNAHQRGDFSSAPVLTRTDARINFNWGKASPGAPVAADQFAAVWNGSLFAPVTGTYTIFITSDDGRRVWIDGKALIDQWVANVGTYSATVDLVAGATVPIRIDYFDSVGSASVKLEWQPPNQARAVIPTKYLFPEALPTGVVGQGTGLLAGYFPGLAFTGTPIIATDAKLNFSWPTVPREGIPSDYFSVRWQGTITPKLNEPTTLIIIADDSAWVWLDGVLMMDGSGGGRIPLPVGAGVAHDLRIDHCEQAGQAVARLEWEGQHTPRQVVPTSQLTPAASLLLPALTTGSGISAAYFANETLTGPPVFQREQTVNFNWGNGSPGSAIPVDHFSARWTGKIQTRFDENYTLIVTGDDGVRLWLDGKRVINDWILTGAKARTYTFPAKAGQMYAIRLEYIEGTGGALAKLEWQSPSEGRQVVPEACLYPNDLNVTIPAASAVSPAFIEGLHGPNLTVNPGTAALTNLGESSFYVDQPLNATAPTTAILKAGTVTSTGAITWTPTLLSGAQTIVIRPGDSLLFKAVVTGTWDIGISSGLYKSHADIKAGDVVPVRFTVPGSFRVNQSDAQGNEVAALTVIVPQVTTTGPIPVSVQYTRNKDVTFANPGDQSVVTWTAADQWIAVGKETLPAGSSDKDQRLTVRSNVNRAGWLVGRVNGGSGPILASFPVRPFVLRSDSERAIQVEQEFPDGSLLCGTALVMEPLVPNLNIKLFAYVSGVTFDDSTTVRWLTSNLFTANSGNGIYSFKLVRSPGINAGVCHAWNIFDDNVKISP